MFHTFPFASTQIVTSEMLGERRQVNFWVPYRGPYQKRRLKRFNRDPRNWRWFATGKDYIMDKGRQIMCHPDDVPPLMELLRIQTVTSATPAR